MSKKHRTKWEKKPWQPVKIIYEPTDEDLTAAAGLAPLIDLFQQSPQYEELRKCLPERKSNASYDTGLFALNYIAGFIYGHDSLDDFQEFENDPGVEDKLGSLPSERAMGDYLRDFNQDNIDKLNSFLTRQALSGRRAICKDNDVVTIDIDSTSHVQSGDKIEGAAWNYKNEWCLDSLVCFDELGLSYNMDLRSGSTFSAVGGPEMIEQVFSQIPKPKDQTKKHNMRADSAFCNEEFIRKCLLLNLKFTITAHDNMNWREKVKNLTQWTQKNYSEDELKKYHKNKKTPPPVEYARFLYEPGWSDNLRFPVVVKRTWHERETDSLLDTGCWHYYAVITNWNLHSHTLQEVAEFHAKRGNGENFIKEEKYGYDLKHFPCQKLLANQAYGMLALVAHNLLRTIAILDSPDKPHYSKKLRRKYVYLPGRLTKHARQLVMKVPKRFWAAILQLADIGKEVLNEHPAWMRPQQAFLVACNSS